MEKDARLLSLEEGFIIYDFILITLFTFVAGRKKLGKEVFFCRILKGCSWREDISRYKLFF